MLDQFSLEHSARVLSAHRMPDDMFRFAETAWDRGVRAIIAGAGGAAHLPGMLAAKTMVPVLGVPVPSRHLQGIDSLYSIVQMPKGIPVATFAIGEAGAANAALFAVAMLARENPDAARQVAGLPRAADRGGACHDQGSEVNLPLLPGVPDARAGLASLGVLGGGQLGRMFVHAAQQLGFGTVVLDPDAGSPAGEVAQHHVCAAYDDKSALARPGARCGAVTHRVRERARRRAAQSLAAQRAGRAVGRRRWRSASTGRARRPSSRRPACPVRRMPSISAEADLDAFRRPCSPAC